VTPSTTEILSTPTQEPPKGALPQLLLLHHPHHMVADAAHATEAPLDQRDRLALMETMAPWEMMEAPARTERPQHQSV